MPIFLVTPLKTDSTSLDAAMVENIVEGDRYQLQANRGWLFKFEGTTIEASNAIKLTGQPPESTAIGAALIVPVVNYYGRGPTDMWEWLKIKLEQ